MYPEEHNQYDFNDEETHYLQQYDDELIQKAENEIPDELDQRGYDGEIYAHEDYEDPNATDIMDNI